MPATSRRFRVSAQQARIMHIIATPDKHWHLELPGTLIARQLFNLPKPKRGTRVSIAMSATQRASLARSLTRLVERGLLRKSNRLIYELTPDGLGWLAKRNTTA